MRVSPTPFLMLVLLVLPMLLGVTTSPTNPALQGSSLQLSPSPGVATPEAGTPPPPPPSPDLAVANWTSNRFWNPGFESWADPRHAGGWGGTAIGDIYHWFATEPPWHVSEGTYSAGMQCRSTSQNPSSTMWSQQGVNALMANLSLRFDWYSDENWAPSHDCFYLMLWFGDGRLLYYILNGSQSATNSSTTGRYVLHEPPRQWNSFSRNLTADYLAIPLFPKTVAYLGLSHLYFGLAASGFTDQYLRGFVDDVNLVNATNNHVWIGGTTHDGNFESHGSGNQWWTRGSNSDAADLRQSPTAHSGSWSLNMTAASYGNYSEASISSWPEARLTSLNQGSLSFWWRLDYQNAQPNSYSYVVLSCDNATHSFQVIYFLGYGGTSWPSANDSALLVLRADQFNTTGSWVAFHRNLWQDAAAYFHTSEVFVLQVMLFTMTLTTTGPSSEIAILLDDAALVSAAINDAGYEDQGSPGTLIRTWSDISSDFTVTDVAYAGNKAANLTIPGERNSYLTQSLIGRPLNATRETYLDVMWRLEDYTPASLTNAYLSLTLTDGRYLAYYLAVSAGELPSNSTSAGYFNVTGVCTTGKWTALHRDLVHDYQAVFGSLPDTSLFYLAQTANTVGSPRLSLLIDDFYLYDDPAPRISNVQRTPPAPEAAQTVLITANIVEQDLAARLMHYRLNGGPWNNVPMSPIGGNNYEAFIPAQLHNTFVEYYLTANDTWGMTTTALNGGAYWSYTTMDYTPPTISSVTRTPSSPTYVNQVNVSAIATDVGSGIGSCALYRRFNGGGWTRVVMTGTGTPNGFYAYIPVQPWNTHAEYYLNATDLAGLSRIEDNGGSFYSYTVGDTVDPVISNVLRTPTIVGYLDPPVVTCDVADVGSGVGPVLIFYRLNGGAWGSAPMTHTTGIHYEITSGAPQPLGTVVEYYVNASDNAGNWAVDNNGGSNYSYTVVDNIKPSVVITAPSPGELVSGTVAVTVTANDTVSSINRVEFFVDGVSVFTNPTAPYGFSWDSATVSNGQHTIMAVAYDGAGNWANDTVMVVTNNATSPPPIPGFPLPAIVMGGVAALGLGLYRRRRQH